MSAKKEDTDSLYKRLISRLSASERLRLVEKIVRDLVIQSEAADGSAIDWMSLRGIAPELLGGEDAQEWVSRSRKLSDEGRAQ